MATWHGIGAGLRNVWMVHEGTEEPSPPLIGLHTRTLADGTRGLVLSRSPQYRRLQSLLSPGFWGPPRLVCTPSLSCPVS